jgi:hypothetical protein
MSSISRTPRGSRGEEAARGPRGGSVASSALEEVEKAVGRGPAVADAVRRGKGRRVEEEACGASAHRALILTGCALS